MQLPKFIARLFKSAVDLPSLAGGAQGIGSSGLLGAGQGGMASAIKSVQPRPSQPLTPAQPGDPSMVTTSGAQAPGAPQPGVPQQQAQPGSLPGMLSPVPPQPSPVQRWMQATMPKMGSILKAADGQAPPPPQGGQQAQQAPPPPPPPGSFKPSPLISLPFPGPAADWLLPTLQKFVPPAPPPNQSADIAGGQQLQNQQTLQSKTGGDMGERPMPRALGGPKRLSRVGRRLQSRGFKPSTSRETPAKMAAQLPRLLRSAAACCGMPLDATNIKTSSSNPAQPTTDTTPQHVRPLVSNSQSLAQKEVTSSTLQTAKMAAEQMCAEVQRKAVEYLAFRQGDEKAAGDFSFEGWRVWRDAPRSLRIDGVVKGGSEAGSALELSAGAEPAVPGAKEAGVMDALSNVGNVASNVVGQQQPQAPERGSGVIGSIAGLAGKGMAAVQRHTDPGFALAEQQRAQYDKDHPEQFNNPNMSGGAAPTSAAPAQAGAEPEASGFTQPAQQAGAPQQQMNPAPEPAPAPAAPAPQKSVAPQAPAAASAQRVNQQHRGLYNPNKTPGYQQTGNQAVRDPANPNAARDRLSAQYGQPQGPSRVGVSQPIPQSTGPVVRDPNDPNAAANKLRAAYGMAPVSQNSAPQQQQPPANAQAAAPAQSVAPAQAATPVQGQQPAGGQMTRARPRALGARQTTSQSSAMGTNDAGPAAQQPTPSAPAPSQAPVPGSYSAAAQYGYPAQPSANPAAPQQGANPQTTGQSGNQTFNQPPQLPTPPKTPMTGGMKKPSGGGQMKLPNALASAKPSPGAGAAAGASPHLGA